MQLECLVWYIWGAYFMRVTIHGNIWRDLINSNTFMQPAMVNSAAQSELIYKEVNKWFIDHLYSNLIGQNVTTMVQSICIVHASKHMLYRELVNSWRLHYNHSFIPQPVSPVPFTIRTYTYSMAIFTFLMCAKLNGCHTCCLLWRITISHCVWALSFNLWWSASHHVWCHDCNIKLYDHYMSHNHMTIVHTWISCTIVDTV